MKQTLEVFFDYACPFCLKGHKNLMEVIADFTDIDIAWHPCESHPRPDSYGPHSDLCIQGYFFAAEYGVDIWKYHERMYQAALIDRIDIEDSKVLSQYVSDIVNADAFEHALRKGRYRKDLEEANELAFIHSGVWAVPAYRMGGEKLDAVENIGITIEQLQRFLEGKKEE